MEKTEKIDYAFWITIVPGLLYLSAYSNKAGAYDTYNIPTDLIFIDLNAVLEYSVSFFLQSTIFILMWFFFQFIYESHTDKPISKTGINLAIISFIMVLSLCSIGMIFFQEIPISLMIVLSVLFTGLLFGLVRGIVFFTNKKSNSAQGEKGNNQETLFSLFHNSFVAKGWFLFAFSIIVPTVSLALGRYNSANKKSYLCYSKAGLNVVLDRSGDYFITKSYDSKSETVSDTITMLKLSDTDKNNFVILEKKIDFEKSQKKFSH